MLKNIIKLFNKHTDIFFIILLLLLASLSFSWFSNAKPLLGHGEVGFVLSPEQELYMRSFLWKDQNLGSPLLRGFSLLIFHIAPMYVMYKLGLSLPMINKLLFFFLLSIAGIGLYLFSKYLLDNKKYSAITSFLAANFYMFNMFSLLFFWRIFPVLFAYGFLPLILLFSIKFVKQAKLKDLTSYLICTLFITPAGDNPIYLFLVFSFNFLFLLIIFGLFKKDINIKRVIKRIFILFVITVALLSFLIIPFLFASFKTDALNVISLSNTNLEQIGRASTFKNFTEGLRFLGHWAFFSKYNGNLYYPYNAVYKTPLFYLLGFFTYFLVLISFFSKEKRIKKYIIIFSVIFVSSYILINGPNYPFGAIYTFLYKNIPYFFVFRNPLDKVGILYIFSFTVLFSFGIFNILVFLNKEKSKIIAYLRYLFIVVIFITINLYAFPFWTGEIFPDYNNSNLTSNKTNVPIYYYQLKEKLNNYKKKNNIFILPMQYTYSTPFNWGYSGTDPLMKLLKEGYVNAYEFPQTKEILAFLKKEDRKDNLFLSKEIYKILGLLNIDNIVVEKDVKWNFYKNVKNPEKILKLFKNNNNIVFNEQFGELFLYNINPEYFLPHFYVPKNIIYSNGKTQDLLDIVSFKDYEIRSGIYLDETGNWKLETGNLMSRADEFFIKSGLENKVREEELGIVVKPEKISFPQVQWKPGSEIYPLALMVEKFNKWKVRKDLEKSFENYLFYGNKRVSEMTAFNISELKDYVLKNYKKEIEGAIDILSKMKELESEDFVSSWVKLKGILWTHQDKIEEIYGNIAVFKELNQELDGLKGKTDFSKLVYQFDIPKKGEYDVFLKDENDEWSKMGSKEFKEGSQEFVVPLGDVGENLLDDNLRIKNYLPDSVYQISFDYQSPEGGSLFVSEGKPGKVAPTTLPPTGKEFRHFEIFFKSSSGATRGSLHLSASQLENLKVEWVYQPEIILKNRRQEIGDRRQETPKITFVKINPTKYRVKVEGAKEPYTLVFSESFHKDWRAYINLQPSGLISPLPVGNQQSAISNQQYGKVVADYFNGDIKEGTHKNIFLDKNTFETWGKKPIAQDRHYLVNGYANSWYIKPEDAGGKQNYEIIIEFGPQRFFYIGLAISGLTLLFCLGFLCYDLIDGARRRKYSSVGFKKLDFSSQES